MVSSDNSRSAMAQAAGTNGAEGTVGEELSLVLTVAYNGAAYSGFARQKDERIPTVQGEIERSLGILFRREVPTVCAGRTDAGVHARAQVVSCMLAAEELEGRNGHKLMVSLNALTPDDICIRGLRRGPAKFSARFDALRREYRYRVVCGAPPALLRGFSWWRTSSLDVDAMREAASVLVGEHDFKSFCKAASAEGKNTVRTLESIDIFPEEQLGEECLCIRVVGNAFLHSMIRTMVGTLVAVGDGRRSPAWVAEVLAARARSAAGETAPAAGLVFWGVEYPQGLLSDIG